MTTGPGEALVDVTPDGRYVLFNTPAAPRTLMVVPADGMAAPRQLASDYINLPIFSRDGKLVSYNRLDSSQPQVGSVRAIVDIENGKTVATLPNRGGYQFTPDGGLTYVQPGQSATDKTAAVPAAIFKVPLNGGAAPQRLFEVPDSRVDLVRLGRRQDGGRRRVFVEESRVQSLEVDGGRGQARAAHGFPRRPHLRDRRVRRR